MIATTISNSISEKPFCFRIFPRLLKVGIALPDTGYEAVGGPQFRGLVYSVTFVQALRFE
jgi:hypothetical protein